MEKIKNNCGKTKEGSSLKIYHILNLSVEARKLPQVLNMILILAGSKFEEFYLEYYEKFELKHHKGKYWMIQNSSDFIDILLSGYHIYLRGTTKLNAHALKYKIKLRNKIKGRDIHSELP